MPKPRNRKGLHQPITQSWVNGLIQKRAKLRALGKPTLEIRAHLLPPDDLPPNSRTPVYYWDSLVPGFFLRVDRNGTMRWGYRYEAKPTVGGKDRRRKIFRLFPAKENRPEWVAVEDDPRAPGARNLARQYLRQAYAGSDPLTLGRTVEELFCEYEKELAKKVAQHESGKGGGLKASTVSLHLTAWRLYVLPQLGAVKVAELTSQDVLRLYLGVGQVAGPTAANRMLTPLRAALDLAEVLGWREEESNPVKVPKDRRLKERRRRSRIESQDFARVWEALEQLNRKRGLWRSARCLQLILATGLRKSEALTAQWADVSVWDKEIPRGRRVRVAKLALAESKQGARSVALTPLAVRVLDSLPSRPESSPYLFPGNKPGQPYSAPALTQSWSRLRADLGLCNVTIHGFRHTLISQGGKVANLHDIQHLIGHANLATTAGVYYHSEFESELQTAIAVSDRLQGLIEKSTKEESGKVE